MCPLFHYRKYSFNTSILTKYRYNQVLFPILYIHTQTCHCIILAVTYVTVTHNKRIIFTQGIIADILHILILQCINSQPVRTSNCNLIPVKGWYNHSVEEELTLCPTLYTYWSYKLSIGRKKPYTNLLLESCSKEESHAILNPEIANIMTTNKRLLIGLKRDIPHRGGKLTQLDIFNICQSLIKIQYRNYLFF